LNHPARSGTPQSHTFPSQEPTAQALLEVLQPVDMVWRRLWNPGLTPDEEGKFDLV